MTDASSIRMAKDLARTRPLVIPFRHPYRIEESYKRRGKDQYQLYDALAALEEFLKLKPLIMPVDSPHRVLALQDLSKHLGIKLDTDWSVQRGVSGTHNIELDDCTPSPRIKQAAERLSDTIARYY